MKQAFLTLLFSAASVAGASAHSVALSENFDGDYSLSFPTTLELDGLPPLSNFWPIFSDSEGVAQPWWRVKDTSSSPDSFIASHSGYREPGQSNDWLVSRAIEIPTEGYTLRFGAQSFIMRTDGDRISDLDVFITEYAPSEGNLPSSPVMHITNVPEGNYTDLIEKDFTYYELSLDDYAGKTIYLSFANLNRDKDILVIDDVLVQRLDNVGLQASSPRYVEKGSYNVAVKVESTTDQNLSGLTLSFNPGNGQSVQKVENISLSPGEVREYTFSSNVEADMTCNWAVTINADGMQEIAATGAVTGLAFIPYHRVLTEEATGTWCVNCPIGIYAMENIIHDPEMSEYVVPVSIHIDGGSPDPMTVSDYAYMFAVNFAPGMRIERDLTPLMFSLEHDGGRFDKDNTLSVANRIKRAHEEIAILGIDLKGNFEIQGTDTIAVNADVTIRPALTLPGNRYAIGFVLTENNVGLDGNVSWFQQNGFSGTDLESGLGGFTSLGKYIDHWRYMDVARAVYGYRGHEDIKFPETMPMDKELTYSVKLPIPDTYVESNGKVTSPAVVASNLSVVAYVVDSEQSGKVINACAFPLTEQAAHRQTIAELAGKILAVNSIEADDEDADAEYFTLQGIKVAEPTDGIYIVRRGSKTSKVLIRK